MYAIVRDRSRSLTLHPGAELWIDRLEGCEAGATHVFDQVSLLKKDDGSVVLGKPTVSGASVVAEVLGEERDEKLYVAKFRRRKGTRTRVGHRQRYTRIRVQEIKA